MNSKRFLRILRKRKWWVVIPPIFFIVAGILYFQCSPKYYRSHTVVLFKPAKQVAGEATKATIINLEQDLQRIKHEVLSSQQLVDLAQRYKLYSSLPDQPTPDEISSQMLAGIKIRTLKGNAFTVEFEGRKVDTVLPIAEEVAKKFINEFKKTLDRDKENVADTLSNFLEEKDVLEKKQQTLVETHLREELESPSDLKFNGATKYEQNGEDLAKNIRSTATLIDKLREDQERLKEKINKYQGRSKQTEELHVEFTTLARTDAKYRLIEKAIAAGSVDESLLRKLGIHQNKKGDSISAYSLKPSLTPHDPALTKILFLSLLSGLGFGLCLALLRDSYDGIFTDPKNLEQATGISVLTTIPPSSKSGKSRAGTGSSISAGFDELIALFSGSPKINGAATIKSVRTSEVPDRYQILKERIDGAFDDDKKCISLIVTSAIPGEGKTTVATQFGEFLANEMGNKVALIDCNFHRPKIASHFRAETGIGFSELLQGTIDLDGALVTVNPEKLYIMSSGTVVSDSLFGHLTPESLGDTLSLLEKEFDYIIFDLPAIMDSVSETNALTTFVDLTLFVVRAEETPRDVVLCALSLIKQDNLIGAVFNGSDVHVEERSRSNFKHPYLRPQPTHLYSPSADGTQYPAHNPAVSEEEDPDKTMRFEIDQTCQLPPIPDKHAKLKVFGPKSAPFAKLLGNQECTIGRHSGCNLTIQSNNISRKHAVVFLRNGEYYIKDLGSTNSTRVNGIKVDESVLRNEDKLDLGDVRIIFSEYELNETMTLARGALKEQF